MLKQTTVRLLLAATAILAASGSASAQQTLNFNIGYFTVRGEDARTGAGCSNCGRDVDVLIADNDFLTFDISDFNGTTIGGEWLIPLGRFAEAGAGLSFSRRTVPSVYTNYVNANGSEVDQNLRLRLLPIDLTVRVVPLGPRSTFQPYFGAGLSVINWRYSEFGNFIDFSTAGRPIYSAEYNADGTNTGPVFVGGARWADGGISVGGEVRYRQAVGDLTSDFASDKLDLGGWSYQATIGYRFGR
jgi:outer membrane protein W